MTATDKAAFATETLLMALLIAAPYLIFFSLLFAFLNVLIAKLIPVRGGVL